MTHEQTVAAARLSVLLSPVRADRAFEAQKPGTLPAAPQAPQDAPETGQDASR